MTATSLTRRLLQGLRRPRRASCARPDFGDCGAELALDMTLAAPGLTGARPAAGPASPIDPTPGADRPVHRMGR